MHTSEHQALQPSLHPPPTNPLVAQWQRIHLPMQETWVRSLGWEDPLEKEMATQCSILAPEIPWTEEPGVLQSQRVGQRLATELEGMHPTGYLVHVFVMYQGRAVQRLELFNICGFISVIVISSAHWTTRKCESREKAEMSEAEPANLSEQPEDVEWGSEVLSLRVVPRGCKESKI